MNNYRTSIEQAKFKLAHAQQVEIEETKHLKEAQEQVLNLQQAVDVVQFVGQSVQQAVHDKIAKVVSSCMEAVFDDAYEFVIRFERKRNRTEAELSFVRDGLEVDPMTASGGGAVDVAAFALRVACLTLQKDLEQILVLDEPFRFLSKEYRPRIRVLLETLSEDLDIQFLIVTHMDILRTGTVIELGK